MWFLTYYLDLPWALNCFSQILLYVSLFFKWPFFRYSDVASVLFITTERSPNGALLEEKFRSTKTSWARPVVTVIWSGHQKLTGITAPCSGSDHLMVDGHYSDQQNRPEQKIFRVAPQFLYRKKSRDHCGSRAKAATELFIGRVTRFVLRRCLTPPRARPTATRLLPLDAHYRRLGYPQYAQHKVAVIYKYYQIPVVPPPWPLHRIGLLQART